MHFDVRLALVLRSHGGPVGRGAGSLLLLGTLLLAGCGDDPVRPDRVPTDHTVVRGGVFHAAGLDDPAAACAGCHGADLRGGPDGQPSCFSCHGAVWN